MMKLSYNQQGFTLVETIVVVGIYTIMTLVIYTSIFNLYRTNSYTIEQSHEVDQARRGLQTWLNDVREMTYADDGTFPVAVMEPHRLGFYSDVDKDNTVEYVEYVLSTTTLFKRTFEPTGHPPVYNLVIPAKTEILSEYVQNLLQATSTFKYYDNSGTELVTPSGLLTDVRYIEAQAIVNIDPLRSPGEFLLRSGVTPRNLKDNL
ncbi:MAG TPA: prepilin-type N-terminal cleavage/methylation domain-containing protein [Candidatus Paceibacterota bacterium]|nr:prepilin-type N-terminal cleavage/methylation domain-containing protein [Candidatus Paceibacterota bacterium]